MSSSRALTTTRRGENSLALFAIALSLVTVAIGILIQPTTGWAGLLIAGYYGLSIAVGASLFAAINAVTGATWFEPLFPVAALISRTLIVPTGALVVTFLLGLHVLYPWAHDAAELSSQLMHEKAAWLNAPFFLARAGIVLLAFLGLTNSLFRQVPDYGRTRAPSRGMGAFFIVLFAGCISIASWDWMMSLEPEWFSTMYGVYGFAGSFLGGIAAVAVLTIVLSTPKTGPNPRLRIGERQIHDLGSLMFGFAMFWAYIWFCQYMLIWYANLPEETP
ncbi:MAG: hypothetical protein V3T05_09270, partial [Myxococcota bacterium]